MNWGTFFSNFAQGASIGAKESLKKGSLTNIEAGMRNVQKTAEKQSRPKPTNSSTSSK